MGTAAVRKVQQALDRVKKGKKRTKRSPFFDDIVTVHTAPSGTQYVSVLEILLDQRAWDEMQRASEVVEAVQKREQEQEQEAVGSSK